MSEFENNRKEGKTFEEWKDEGIVSNYQSNYENAIKCFDNALELNSEYADVWYFKGRALLGLGRNEDAIKYLDKAIELNPNDADAWGDKGTTLNYLHRYEDALKCLDKSLELEADDDVAWNNKGNTFRGMGKNEDALECYDRALELNPRDNSYWCNKALVLGSMVRMDEARKCCDKALEIDPKDATALHIKGIIGLERNEDKAMLKEKETKSETEWYNKGYDLTESGDHEQALKCFDNVLELNPENADAWMNKGYILFQKLNKEDEGMDCFKKGLHIRQSLHQEGHNDQIVGDMLAKYYGRRAKLAIDKGENGKAAQEFENALEYVASSDLKMNLTCNCATAIINKLDVKNRDGSDFSDNEYNELQKSLELYRQVIKIYEGFSDDNIFKSDQTLNELYDQAKTNIKAFRLCGIAKYDAKKEKYELRRPITEEEKKYIKSKYKIELCDSEAEFKTIEWINKGKSCAQSEKYEDALECFDKALELDPENADAYIGKGYTFDKIGEKDKGMEYLEKGLRIEQSLGESSRQYVKDDLARYHMNIAKTAKDKGLMERALQELDKALRYEPSNDIKILLTEVYATYIVIKLDVKNRGGGADLSDDEYNELQKSLKMYDQVISMYEELNEEEILKSNLPLKDAYEQAKKNIVAYGLFGSVRRDESGALVNRISNEKFIEKKKMMRLKLTEDEIREKRQELESNIKSLKQERNKKYNEAGKIAYTKYKNNEPNFTGVSDLRVKWYAILAIDSEINKINKEIEALNSKEKKSGFFAKLGDLVSTTAKQGKSKIDLYSLGKKKENSIIEFGEQLYIDHKKGTITLEEISSISQGIAELEKQINATEDEISHL